MSGNRAQFVCVALLLAVVVSAITAEAQLRVMPEVPITADGSLQFGYTGGLSSGGPLSTDFFIGTIANVNGYWHDPRFLKFNIAPDYHWSRNNQDEFTTADNNQSVALNLDFLNSTSMPLNFHYSFARTHSANLTGGALPISVSATGTSNDYGINWSFHRFQRLPTFSISYSRGSSDSSVEALDRPDITSSRSGLTITSNYMFAKFHLAGSYNDFSSSQKRPDFFGLGVTANGDSKQKNTNFSVSRTLPWHSNFDARAGRTDTESDFTGSPVKLTFDTAGANLNSSPTERLNFNYSLNYTSNASAEAFSNAVVGGTTSQLPIGVVSQGASTTVSQNFGSSYALGRGLWVTGGFADTAVRLPASTEAKSDSVSVGAMYSRLLFRGGFHAGYTFGYNDLNYTAPTSTNATNSISHNVTFGYVRRLGRWSNQVSFQFADNGSSTDAVPVPIVSRNYVVDFTTSTRLLHRWNLSGGFNISKTETSYHDSGGSVNKGFNVALSNRTWVFMVQDTINSGYSIVSSLGLVPVDSVLVPALVKYTYESGSNGLSFNLSYTKRRLRVTTSYSNSGVSLQNLSGQKVSAGNGNLDTKLYYKFRKLDVRAGYRWWSQSSTANTGLDRSTQGWYFEIVRQFRIF